MRTFTVAITYTHTVTYVTTKMLLTLKEIIREIGLDPVRFTDSWHTYEGAISAWLSSRHLQRVSLEVYDPRTSGLVIRWDMDVVYATVGDGALWVGPVTAAAFIAAIDDAQRFRHAHQLEAYLGLVPREYS